jgi:geranylgeranyl diphosphate synthase type I
MGFDEELDKYGKSVEDQLRKHLSLAAAHGERYHPLIGRLYNSIEEYTMRKGKKLAAASTLVTYEGYSGAVDERILRIACGVEIYRQAILVHDDLVDADIVRRGGGTLHRLMEEGYDERFGAGSSIFSGNILFSMALNAMMSSGFSPQKLVKASSMLLSEYQNVNESQILDLMFEYKSPDVREWEVMASKRAATLFRATLGIGAILGGANEQDLACLAEAGEHIGYAFDIQDDIIDTFASEEQYGRPPCTDVLKGKKPLHIILALDRDKRFASALADIRAGKRAVDVEFIRRTVRDSGALDEARKISKEHAEIGRRTILETGMSAGAKKFFHSLIDYVEDSLDWYK